MMTGDCQICYNMTAVDTWKIYPVCKECLMYVRQWEEMTPEEQRADYMSEARMGRD